MLDAQAKTAKAVEVVDDDLQEFKQAMQREIHELKLEIERLKTREAVVISEAKAAAAAAAGLVTAQSVAETSRRIGVLEGRLLTNQSPQP